MFVHSISALLLHECGCWLCCLVAVWISRTFLCYFILGEDKAPLSYAELRLYFGFGAFSLVVLVVSASFCYSTRKWETLKKRIICRTFFSLFSTSLVSSLLFARFVGCATKLKYFPVIIATHSDDSVLHTLVRLLTGCSVVGWGAWKWHWSDSRCAGIFHILYLIKSFGFSERSNKRARARRCNNY